MPRRRRYASKSKGGSREWPAAARRGARPQLAQAAADRQLVADLERPRERRPAGRPREQVRSPKPPGRDLDLGGRAKGPRPRGGQEVGPQGQMLAVADAVGEAVECGEARCPTRQPASTSAPAKAASRGARSELSEAAISAAATSTSAAGDSARTSPPPRHAIETCHGRRRKSAATGRAANPLGGSGEAPRDVRARSPSRLQRVLKRREALLADALDLAQLAQRTEAAVGGAVFEDPLRQRRADAVELVELLDRGCSEAELGDAGGAGRSRARWSRPAEPGPEPRRPPRLPARARSPAVRPRAWRPGSRRRGPLEAAVRRRGPPLRPRAILGQPLQTRMTHRARHVDVDAAARGCGAPSGPAALGGRAIRTEDPCPVACSHPANATAPVQPTGRRRPRWPASPETPRQ